MLTALILTLVALAPGDLPAVSAVAFAPDGSLAAGTVGEVTLFNADGRAASTLSPGDGRVTALAFAPTGELAVASGEPGRSGVLRVYRLPGREPVLTAEAHPDSILSMQFSPDGDTLATASYDRTVKLWAWKANPTGPRRTLTDHSDSVYAVSFRPDGKLIATGSADRTVKLWDAATGDRLTTLSDATDWVYSVAWQGSKLYAAGVDRSLRVYEVTGSQGKLLAATVAHSGPVLSVRATQGDRVVTLAEDGTAKLWAGPTLAAVATSQNLAGPLALAADADGGIAVGRFGGELTRLKPETLAAGRELLPLPPTVFAVSPDAVSRGPSAVVTLRGRSLDRLTSIVTKPELPARLLPGGTPAERKLWLGPGDYAGPVTVSTPGGDTLATIAVDYFAVATSDQTVKLPATFTGRVGRPGAVVRHRVTLTAGEAVGMALTGPKSPLKPVIAVSDSSGRLLAEGAGRRLAFTAAAPGDYTITVRDEEFRGQPEYEYRLHAGPVPVVTGVFPLSVPRGGPTEVTLLGVNLGDLARVTVTPSPTAADDDRVKLPLPPSLGERHVTVRSTPTVRVEAGRADLTRLPATAAGILDAPTPHRVTFAAKKGERLTLEVHAARAGSPVDSLLTIHDDQGRPVPQARLRAVSRVFTTFRDHAATATGIRLEAWNELAVNDFLYADGELMRVLELPSHPDADAFFTSTGGRRRSYLGTTPSDLPVGTALYKVEQHPPGTEFPANGLPVVDLVFQNDDALGADSQILFTAPADGVYTAVIADAQHAHGPDHVYELSVRPTTPGFRLKVEAGRDNNFKAVAGTSVPLTITANRLEGFAGPISVQFGRLPEGYSLPDTTIEAEQTTATVPLTVAPTAKSGEIAVGGRALIDGRNDTQSASAKVNVTTPKLDFKLTTDTQEVVIRPGGRAKLRVRVERLAGFTGRVPCEVKGLPHGVRVIDLGLNGVLLTPGDTSREVVIEAEPWVAPLSRPFTVFGVSERGKFNVAAPAVTLVVPGPSAE